MSQAITEAMVEAFLDATKMAWRGSEDEAYHRSQAREGLIAALSAGQAQPMSDDWRKRAASVLECFDKAKAEPLVALANYGDIALSLLRSALSVPLPEIEGGDKGDGWAEPGVVYVEVSGLTGSGKSAVMGEIEIALRSIGLVVEHDKEFQSEKNMTHADWQEALELYKPRVKLVERNISRRPSASIDGETQ